MKFPNLFYYFCEHPDPGGQKRHTKIEKSKEFSCFEVLDVLFRGLKASPVFWASFRETQR
jgi:hypothetical protein